MSDRRNLFLAAVALGVIAIAIVTGTNSFIGALLALVLPGYAIFAAISSRGGTAASERVLFSLGLSFITTALGAIVLHLTPLGVVPLGWLALLGGVTATGLIVTAMRESLPSVPIKIERLPALLFAIAIIIVVAAGFAARTGADDDPSASVMQLWMLPIGSGIPQLEVGLRSSEGGRYRLEIWRGTKKYREWSPISLSPGQLWRQAVPTPAGSGPVEVRLYPPDPAAPPLRVVTVTPLTR